MLKISGLLKALAPMAAAGLIISCLIAPAARADELTLMAVGDVLPHPSWQPFELSAGKQLEDVALAFFEADVVVGNLESPLTGAGEPTEAKSPASILAKKDFVFKAEDPQAASGLMGAGLSLLTLANNHTMDYREAGLLDTLSRLKAAGIKTAGAGANSKEANAPAVMEVRDAKLVFLAASDVVPKDFWAEPDKPGIVSMKAESAFIRHVEKVSGQHPGAILVVSLHWGVEAALSPNSRQKKIARMLIDAGADLIIGHGPHRLQGVEFYRGRPIFYSLGNFMFDADPPADQSAIAQLVYEGGSPEPVRVSVRPVKIMPGGSPRLLSPDEPEYAGILEGMAGMSRTFGVTLAGEQVVLIPPAKKEYTLEDLAVAGDVGYPGEGAGGDAGGLPEAGEEAGAEASAGEAESTDGTGGADVLGQAYSE